MGNKISPNSAPKDKANEKEADKPHSSSQDKTEHELVPKRHSCTDIICLVLFLIFGLVQVILSLIIFINGGDPRNILLPYDSSGNLCQGSRPNLFYLNLAACLNVNALLTGCTTPTTCVASCPASNLFYLIDSQRSALYKSYCIKDNSNAATVPSSSIYSTLVLNQSCPGYALSSQAFYYRCVPSFVFNIVNGIAGNGTFLTANDTLSNTIYNITDLSTGNAMTDKIIYQAAQYITTLLNYKAIGNLKIFKNIL